MATRTLGLRRVGSREVGSHMKGSFFLNNLRGVQQLCIRERYPRVVTTVAPGVIRHRVETSSTLGTRAKGNVHRLRMYSVGQPVLVRRLRYGGCPRYDAFTHGGIRVFPAWKAVVNSQLRRAALFSTGRASMAWFAHFAKRV